MALSEHEQRLLDELEARLSADDPRLARTLSGATAVRPVQPRRTSLCALGVAVGLAALLGGMQLHPVVSVLGFLVMLVSLVVGLGTLRAPDPQREASRLAHPSNQAHRRPHPTPEQRSPHDPR